MKKITLLFIILAILVTACQASPTPSPAETDSFDTVRAHIERLVAEGKVPSMAVAVARDGEIVLADAPRVVRVSVTRQVGRVAGMGRV